MGATRQEVEATELAKEHGRWSRRSKHGDLYDFPNGMVVCLPTGSPSDGNRAWKNTLADVKRAMRANGIATLDDQQEDEPVAEMQKLDPQGRIEAVRAGLHVERRKRTVEVTTSEATVDLRALVAALGIEAREGAKITAQDASGADIGGPIVFLVEESVEVNERLP